MFVSVPVRATSALRPLITPSAGATKLCHETLPAKHGGIGVGGQLIGDRKLRRDLTVPVASRPVESFCGDCLLRIGINESGVDRLAGEWISLASAGTRTSAPIASILPCRTTIVAGPAVASGCATIMAPVMANTVGGFERNASCGVEVWSAIAADRDAGQKMQRNQSPQHRVLSGLSFNFPGNNRT